MHIIKMAKYLQYTTIPAVIILSRVIYNVANFWLLENIPFCVKYISENIVS